MARVGDTWVQVGLASAPPLVAILAAQHVRAKRLPTKRRSSLFGESTAILANVLVRDSEILSGMPLRNKKRLAEDFFKDFPNISTDPVYTLEAVEEMFTLWLHGEPGSPPSDVSKHVRYDGIFRGVLVDRVPDGPPPKGARGYFQKGISGYLQRGIFGYLQKGIRVYVRPEAAEATNPQPKAAEVTNPRPDAAEVINSDECLRIEWSALNDDIRSIYEILGPPPLKTLSGVRDGR